MRTPIVSRPAVATIGTLDDLGRMTVSGPGKNLSINRRAAGVIRLVRESSCDRSEMCAIRGLSEGRPLATNIFRTASSLKISAPSPYTVSVGKATSSPCRMNRAAIDGDCVTFVFTSCYLKATRRTTLEKLRPSFAASKSRQAGLKRMRLRTGSARKTVPGSKPD